MMTILLIILIIVLLGGGGGYYAHGRYGGAGLGGVLGLVVDYSDRALARRSLDAAPSGRRLKPTSCSGGTRLR